MIYVNIFNIRDDQEAIQVSVQTLEGYFITSARLWTYNTFKDESRAINLSYKLEQINNREVFLITPSDIGQSNLLCGIYFLELESNVPEDECSDCNTPVLAITANFNIIKECILNKVLELSICDGDIFTDASCNGNEGMNIINLNLLLKTLCIALELGYYYEAIDIYKSLIKLCEVDENCTCCNRCNSCNGLAEPAVRSGLGYGTLNNTLILV